MTLDVVDKEEMPYLVVRARVCVCLASVLAVSVRSHVSVCVCLASVLVVSVRSHVSVSVCLCVLLWMGGSQLRPWCGR